jgi:acyl-CoA synthetase (NDP forming)/GNAT superfamily N-acetyltransferase
MGTYALLADGTAVEVRPARAEDYEAVRDMHAAMSPENTYLRFFDPSPRTAEREARRVCREADGKHAALLAWLGGELVGVASYERTPKPGVAEIAFAVTDHLHGRGVATLLLEHLVSLARSDGLAAFTAVALAANSAMLGMFTDAGLPVQRRAGEGMVEFTLRLPTGDADPCLGSYLSALDFREGHANAGSLRHLLLPRSVAVIGTGPQPAADVIARHLVTGGFCGKVYAVMPGVPETDGVTHVPSVSDLPEPVDLAVVTVPPGRVVSVASHCGRRGAKALIVTTVGLDGAQRARLYAICRQHGMRLAGPGSFGVAVPGTGLDATLAVPRLVPGKAGLVTQSGAPGSALAGQLSRLGIGVSSFVSVGGESDVSAVDMLMWWAQDGMTRLAVVLAESFASPRKFARMARRLSQSMPVLTMEPGQPADGAEAAASPAMAAVRRGRHQALFEQAGIVVAGSTGELLETTALLSTQPIPTGKRVSVIASTGAAAMRAAAACTEAGLLIDTPASDVQRQLSEIVPPGGAVTGPVHTTASVTPDKFRRCLELAVADHGADAALVVVPASATAGALTERICTADVGIPLAVVVSGQPEAVRLFPARTAETSARVSSEGRRVPAYASCESAARALANAVKYAAWRERPRGSVPEFDDLRPASARALVGRFLAEAPAGGWLPPPDVGELLSYYGLPLAAGCPAYHEETAGTAAPVITDDAGVIISVVQEPAFGPMVVLRRRGVSEPDVPVVRMMPATDADADELLQTIHPAPPESGHLRSRSPAAVNLRETLLRLSRLAGDLPPVAELHLDPISSRPDGVSILEASVRLAPAQHQDPFLRQLP